MTAGNPEFLFSVGLIDDATLFAALFSTAALTETFEADFATTTGKGTDRLNGFQFSLRANQELARTSRRGLSLHPLNSGKSHIGPLSNSFGCRSTTDNKTNDLRASADLRRRI